MGSVGKFDLHVSECLFMKFIDTHNALTSTIARSAHVVVVSVKWVISDFRGKSKNLI